MELVDVAHRAALLYSFATLLIAAFTVIAFFVFAISTYAYHGLARDTDNQFRDGDEAPGLHPFMWALIVVEIAGFGVLLAGFVSEQIL